MNDQFAKMIRKMENEITALKTAHERGLGMVDFYSKSASVSTAYTQWGVIGIYIRATVADGELSPAFCQPQLTVTNAKSLYLSSFSQSGSTLTWYYLAQGSESEATTASTKVVSASKLSTLTIGTS